MNISSLTPSMMDTLFASVKGFEPPAAKPVSDTQGLAGLASASSKAKTSLTQISASGKKLNELYGNLKKTGNESALTEEGFPTSGNDKHEALLMNSLVTKKENTLGIADYLKGLKSSTKTQAA